MQILAIGAHFDDIELGCGGSLLHWKQQRHKITLFVATQSGYDDPQGRPIRSSQSALTEGQAAARYIDAELLTGDWPTFCIEFDESLNASLVDLIQTLKPDLLLTHWGHDVHHDHQVLAKASLHCSRHVPRLLTYRSNWYCGDRSFKPNFFVDISKTFTKKQELIQIYASENRRTNGSWIDYITAEAKRMGLIAGTAYAEGFEVIKWLA